MDSFSLCRSIHGVVMYCHTVVLISNFFFFGITIALDSTRSKIFKSHESVELDYRDLLMDILEKDSRGSEVTVIEISEDCPNCNMVLSTLMESLKQSFFIADESGLTNLRRMKGSRSLNLYNSNAYKFVIILVKNFDESFEHFENLRQQYDWNPRAKHLIVTATEPSEKKLQLFFEECWKHRVLNVGVSIYNSEQFYTYNRYLSNSPYEKVDASNLFYDKLRDMMGYPIRAKYFPLIDKNMAKWNDAEKKFKFFDVDWSYSEIFFRSVNATPEYLNLTNEDVRRFSNFTYRFAHWKHREFGSAELWLNAVAANYKFRERFEELYPLAQDGAFIIAPKSSRNLLSVFNLCDEFVWMFLGMSFMAFNLYAHILYKCENIIVNTFLISYAIFFGQYFPKLDNFKPIEKSTFFLWAFFGAFLLNTHQGVLYGVLTTSSYKPEVDYVSQVPFRTNTIYTYEDLHDIIVDYVSPTIKIIFLGTEDYYDYMQTHRNYFYTLHRTSAEFIVKRPKLQSETGVPFFHVIKDCLLPTYLTYFVPYGSPYLNKMNRAVRIFKESGLHQYWANQVNLIALLNGKIISPDHELKLSKSLSISTHIPTFSIWIGGLLVSFFCCAYEVYREKRKNSR